MLMQTAARKPVMWMLMTVLLAIPPATFSTEVRRVSIPSEGVEDGDQARRTTKPARSGLLRQVAEAARLGRNWPALIDSAGIARDGDALRLELRLGVVLSRASDAELTRNLGFRLKARNVPGLVDAWVPLSRLDALLDVLGDGAVQPAQRVQGYQALPGASAHKTGSVQSEGVAASGLAPYHALGADGTGTVIALMDQGFQDFAARQASGDWPSGSQLRFFVVDGSTVHECPGPAQCSSFDAPANGSHGTSNVEIAFDAAPGATFWVYQTRFVSEWYRALDHASDTANHPGGLRADVISASLSAPLNGIGDGSACPPMWGSPCGTVAEAAELAFSRGSLVVNAAGNNRFNHWGGPYVPSSSPNRLTWWGANNQINYFGPGVGTADCIADGTPIYAQLFWDDWAGLPTHDYDLRLFEWTGSTWRLRASSIADQNGSGGQQPRESISWTSATNTYASVCGAGAGVYGFRIDRWNAPTARNLQFFAGPHDLVQPVFERSLGFPADSPAVFAVGALDASGGFDQQSSFSSEGPALAAGGGLPPPSGSTKLDGMSFSGVSTVTDGPSAFGGTSAATPQVAGVAAVLAQMRLEKPVQTTAPATALHQGLALAAREGDNDLGAPGHDTRFGHGRIRLRSCVQSINLLPNRWYLVGLPCDARAGNTIGDAFGSLGLGTYGTDWGLWNWNPAAGTYQLLPASAALALGQGYWLYSVNAGSGSLSGLVADISEAWGEPTTGAGWPGRAYLLSNPRRFTLDWEQVRFHYEGGEHDLAAAVSDGKVRSMMWRWDPVGGDYQEFNGLIPEGQIGPGDAFWIRVLEAVEVRLPTSPEPILLGTQSRRTNLSTSNGWAATVYLEGPDGTRSSVRFGHHPRALDGYDAFDAESFPTPAARPHRIVLPRYDLGVHAADYVRDMRTPKRRDAWEMHVRTSRAGTVALRWDAPPHLLAGLFLMDEATGETYAAGKWPDGITLKLDPGVRRFSLHYRGPRQVEH